jgi:hypothetical protein
MKNVNNLNGLHKLNTMLSARKRGIPKLHRSNYLDMYILSKERERLLKENERLNRRKLDIDRRLSDINAEVTKMQEDEHHQEAGSSKGSAIKIAANKRKMKKMSLSY